MVLHGSCILKTTVYQEAILGNDNIEIDCLSNIWCY